MKISYYIYILFSFAILTACSKDDAQELLETNTETTEATLYFPPLNTDTWETTTLSELGWNANAEQPLYDFLEANDTKGFLILKNGKIVLEQYFNGSSASNNNPWYSAAKTLTAFTIGIAQQEGLLDITDPSANYLGTGWSSLTTSQEAAITIRHHLTMTTGLEFNVSNTNCTDSNCLTYRSAPNSFWYYHNATYTLLDPILTSATQQDYKTYFNTKVRDRIGMDGAWISIGYINVYYSTLRSMARFGLLSLNKGTWENTAILENSDYFTDMTTTSQELNTAYGYLWWLNGNDSYRAPGSDLLFSGALIPNAPSDLIAGLGANDQKLYVVPSENLVIVRMGNEAGEALLGPSSFDNELWEKINDVIN